MASVTRRISEIKQPKGGYIKPSEFETITFDDGIALNANENVHAIVIGLAVDYLTRFAIGGDVVDAFRISLLGAKVAEKNGFKGAMIAAARLLSGIKSLDNDSVINACKLVTFDVWCRNSVAAVGAKKYSETNPDKETIENIQTLVKRSITFFEKYGPITNDGFGFGPDETDMEAYFAMVVMQEGSYGGYTPTVDSGDGDFLTSDTLWDFKVSKHKPTSKHTLQLLMYWIMGQHSGQEIFKSITKLGIFNPRLNTVYLLNIDKVPEETIKAVENEVICYQTTDATQYK